MKTARLALALACVLAFSAPAWGGGNPPMTRKFPSSHALVHYYCPNCEQAEKDHVAWCASIINHGDANTFQKLVPTHPEVKDLINIKYRFVQYVPILSLDGGANPQGDADRALLSQFAAENGYDEEDFYLHYSQPTRIDWLGATMVYDGTKVTLTDTNGQTHVFPGSRAVSMVWSDFYYFFNWASEGWYRYMKERVGLDFADLGGFAFDGLFKDGLNGPISDSFQGIGSGGGLVEFGGLTPPAVSAQHLDSARVAAFQARLDADHAGKVFLPNSGDYMDSWAEQVMAAGDGTITELVNYPGATPWKESWGIAKRMAEAGDYYSIATYWDRVPDDFPPGVYATGTERTALHDAAWYWMAYEPGYVAFDVSRACCDWSAQWPKVMEADLGSPTGDPTLAASGALAGGWRWSLWAREYEKATVYFRGNNAWRDGNGGSIGLGETTGVAMPLPAGTQILRGDGTWAAAPAQVTHYDGFGLVVKKEAGGDDDSGDDSGDDTGDVIYGDDTDGGDDTGAGDDTDPADDSGDDTVGPPVPPSMGCGMI